MGVDCVAILPHALSHPNQLDVAALTNGIWMQQMARKWEGIHSNAENWARTATWNLLPSFSSLDEKWQQEGYVSLNLPGGFNLTFARRLIELYHVMRWSEFVTEVESRTDFRNVCHDLAQMLGCTNWLYVPDNFYMPSGAIDVIYEGGDWEQVLQWLRTQCSPLSLDPRQLYPGWSRQMADRGYFLDSFLLFDECPV